MDEQRYYNIQRDVDLLKQHTELMEKKMDGVISRQERHEEKITDCIEKLTTIVASVDKKIDVTNAQLSARSSLWEKFIQFAPYILFGVIGGLWTYNQSVHQDIQEVQEPTPIIIQKK